MKAILCLLSFFIATQLASAASSSLDKQIVKSVDEKQQEQIALLEQLVNINSGTTNINGVYQVGQILEKEFKALGFTTRWVEEPASMKRAGTLIAQRLGHRGKRLLLIGHLDTVFPANSPFQRFERQGSLARGPGVIDDKGGDVVILYALKALEALHALDDAQITVVLTGDEEDSGKPTSISRKPLIDVAKESDVALDFEEAVTLDTATIARRGVSMWTLKVQGKEGHSSLIFNSTFGAGAVFEMARILNTLRLELVDKDLSFNAGLVLGGTSLQYDKEESAGKAFGKANVIAKAALAQGDLRFISAHQESLAMEKMKAIVNKHLALSQASIVFQPGIPAMSPTQANRDLLDTYSEVSERMGLGKIKALRPGLRGAGDISHISAIVGANLAGLGPLGKDSHSIKETIDLNSLPIQTKRAAGLIHQLIQ